VRPRAGFEYQQAGESESFAAFEFDADAKASEELRIVLDKSTTNVLWPLGENRYRWTFQLLRSELSGDFPQKERRSVRVAEPSIDERIRQYIEKIAQQRAPWFEGEIQRVHWCTEVTFERRLVTRFGRNRCWLAGDAAHQTGPVGVQSMNLGFFEADALGSVLQKILREAGSLDLLEAYDRDFQNEWRALLGLSGGLKPLGQASPWATQHGAKILPCLPGHGTDLAELAGQLGLVPAW
jgi:2-polyprenyl-6-methoxyphenol hydroxylase-like FAD-dependent oxidoreductase